MQQRLTRQQRVFPLLLGLSIFGGTVGCSGDHTTALEPSLTQTYWSLQLNYRAVNLALNSLNDTVQLVATPMNPRGTSLTNLGEITWSVADSSVTVSPTGLMTAHFATPGTFVTARLKAQNLTLTDTVWIQVTDTVPQHPVATLSMQSIASDSAKRSLDFLSFDPNFGGLASGFPWKARITNVAGDTVCDTVCPLLVYYTSLDPSVATIDSKTGRVQPRDTGNVTLTAMTYAYGVALRDSVRFRIGYTLNFYEDAITFTTLRGISRVGFTAPPVMILGVGAVVTWWYPYTSGIALPIDVVFDNPIGVDTATTNIFGQLVVPPNGSGDIAPWVCDTDPTTGACQFSLSLFRSRRFTVPGTYHYHSSLFPSDTFTIFIKND